MPALGQTVPAPTTIPIPPTFDLQATKEAIDAANARLQTKTAVEQQIERERQEAEAYARSVEATRVANLPTSTPVPTPTPEPTPTPLPTPTPHSSTYCRDWEDMVLAWIHQGNNYHGSSIFAYQAAYSDGRIRHSQSLPPEHEQLTLADADKLCITGFPKGRVYNSNLSRHWEIIGIGRGELLPGTYKYWSSNGDDRVEPGGPVLYGGNFVNNVGETVGPDVSCGLVVNRDEANESWVDMIYGQPFEFTFFTYHGGVTLDKHGWGCYGFMYRVGS